MNTQELKELYLKRQSCRKFSTKEVSKELLNEVATMAMLAPSACNLQPWKLVIATGEKKKEVEKTLQHLGMNKFASDAPVLVAIASNADKGPKAKMTSEFVQHDLGVLTAHLVLAAESAGLSTCILGWRKEDEVRKILSLPKDTSVPVVIALGYAADGYETRAKSRKKVEEVVIFAE